MMTFRVGAAGSSNVASSVAEYYMTGTVQSESVRAAEYYSGLQERADSFWRGEVIDGRLEMGQHQAELRAGVSAAMSRRLGLDAGPLTQQRVANLLSLKKADGDAIEGRQIHRPHADGKKPPVGFLDLTLSAPKSLSVAWALAPSGEERDKLLGVHKAAVEKTMRYVSEEIGYTQRGGKDNRRSEEGEVAWIGFQHYTARPVAGQAADPQLHSHQIVLPHVLTDQGHMGALDLDGLSGRIKEFGSVYQAHIAAEARALGVRVEYDERHGSARLSDIPEHVADVFAKRTMQAKARAYDLARDMGLDWESLNAERRAGVEKAAAHLSRQSKVGEMSDFASWSRQADAAGYRYESVLGRVETQTEAPVEREQAAYETALPMLGEEFTRRAVLDENELRRVAAQALITAGIGNAGKDIDAVMKSFRRDGVDYDGQRVSLVSQEAVSVRGKERVRVTTGLHIAQEEELLRLARSAATDRSAALTPGAVNRAVDGFLASHPAIDATGSIWEGQRRMIDHLGSGGRLGVVIGVPGAGKSVALAPLVQAWGDEGRKVYGISLAWRQAGDLRSAGIEEVASIAAFTKRVEGGRYALDQNSVVVVDEVGLVGSRQMLDLLRIQERTGAQLVMIGDPRQNQPVEGAPGLALLREALGEEEIPRLLYSVRQDTERERSIAAMFRRGQTAEALALKREDGTAMVVSGGRAATVQRVAELWRERRDANSSDPRFTLTVSVPTNADAREVGAAIRDEWRRGGHMGEDVRTVSAVDRTGETYGLPLAIGDRVRLFDRVYDPAQRRALASNGDVVEVRRVDDQGLVVRNAGGMEGRVPWDKIRSNPEAPVRLAHGYALTVDAAQGSTAIEHIHALPSGSQTTHGFKSYTAATRHRRANWLVIDGASEREEIGNRAMIGHRIEISEQDVWKNIAKNVDRHPQKPSAVSVVRQRQAVP